jgi:segregation and condensation protein A
MAEGIRIPFPPGADLVQPYPVKLAHFEGPLDLLLHLVRKNEVDLRDIPVAEICKQYHEYLVLMQELDLEVAAEFLYFAALLLQVKSQMLLPRTPAADGEPAPDPREDLVKRLLEYQKIKGVAETLHEMEAQRLGIWSRAPAKPAASVEEEEADLSEVSLFDLLSFFRTALERHRALHPPAMEIAHAVYSIKQKMEDMLGRVTGSGGRSALTDVFRSLSGRAEAIATFLAVLELLRLGMVRAVQAEEFSEIFLESTGVDTSLESYEEAYR